MIVVNEQESALECTLCGELEGVSAKALANKAVLMVLMDRVARDHAECEQYAGDMARIVRQYRMRMRAEMAILERTR